MSIFDDDYLEHAEAMPLATAGQMRMWNLTLPGVDLDRLSEDRWVFVNWAFAYRSAVRFLELMGMRWEEIQKALALPDIASLNEVPARLTLETRHRLYDVHRIHIAIILLYPGQRENQKYWFSAKYQGLEGKTAIEVMTSEGANRVRKLLEGRLNS